MHARVRTWLMLAAIGLVLGVCTTYGIAWWMINRRWTPVPVVLLTPPLSTAGPIGWSMTLREHPGAIIAYSEPLDPQARDCLLYAAPRAVNEPPPARPSWSPTVERSPKEFAIAAGGPTGFRPLQEGATGWPCVAVVDRMYVPGLAMPSPISGCDLSYRAIDKAHSWGR
jgi:hypothetical protein